MQDALNSLSYAVRLSVLAKYLGLLALMLAGLVLMPLLGSILFGDYHITERYLIIFVILLVAGLPSLWLDHPTDLHNNESLSITALAFIITPLLMTYPMMGSGLSFLDAWFEAVSAVTTTGLSTVANLEQMPRTFLFARAWMQWYGGLGIVILSVAILMNHHIALRRLVSPNGESILTTTRVYARRTLVVYLVLTLLGLGLLMLLLDNIFLALTHTLAAISTGGFSPLNDSLGDLTWPAQLGISLLGLCGAIPFILYYRLVRGSWHEVITDIELRALLFITLLMCLLLSTSLSFYMEMNWQEAARHGVLLGISAQSTTGFASLNLGTLDNTSMGLLIVAMVIGGGVGSTAGGFKLLRLLILLRLIQLIIRRSAIPTHAVVEPHLGDKILQGDEIERALLLILLYLIVITVSWLIFLAYGYAPLPALFEVTSASGTVGLSSGVTSQALDPVLKVVLCIDMLLGRLEIVALLVVLYPGTWLGKRTG